MANYMLLKLLDFSMKCQKVLWKRRRYFPPTFSPISTMFSKGFFVYGPLELGSFGKGLRVLIDCMMFNAIFNVISVISLQLTHLPMLSKNSFYQCSTQYSFQATEKNKISIRKTIDRRERGIIQS